MSTRLEDLEVVFLAAEAYLHACDERDSGRATIAQIALAVAVRNAAVNAAKRAAESPPLPAVYPPGSDPTCDCPACRIGRGLKPLTRVDVDGAGMEGGTHG